MTNDPIREQLLKSKELSLDDLNKVVGGEEPRNWWLYCPKCKASNHYFDLEPGWTEVPCIICGTMLPHPWDVPAVNKDIPELRGRGCLYDFLFTRLIFFKNAEYANDVHYEFSEKDAERIQKLLPEAETLPESLAAYLRENNEENFAALLLKNHIRVDGFHF